MSFGSFRSATSLVVVVALALTTTGGVIAAPAKIPVTLTISASPDPAWVGETITVTYTVTPIPDGGSVYTIGAFHPLDLETGTYTEQRTYPSSGDWQITGLYSGTDLYMGTTYVAGSVVIRQHPVSATLDVPDQPVERGDPFQVTVDLDVVPDGGRVWIQQTSNGDPGPILRYIDVTPSQPMTIDIAGMEPGDYQLRASFEGTAAYTPATSATLPLTVFDRPTTTTLELGPNPSLLGEIVDVTASVWPVPDDGGAFRLYRDDLQIDQFPMNAVSGIGTTSLISTSAGPHAIKAVFVPAGYQVSRWGGSSDTVTQSVDSTPVELDPPVGTIEIDGGAALTADGFVTVSMHATDASGIVQVQMSCDGVHWVDGGMIDGDMSWGNGNGGPGCVKPDGLWTIYARWRDPWGTWGQASDSIILDANAPIGSIEPEGGASYTDSPAVTLEVPATDAGSGVEVVAISNDGSAWIEMPYTPTVDWSLGSDAPVSDSVSESLSRSVAGEVAITDGTKTVFAKWRDGNDHWSEPESTSIILDRAPPTASAPGLSLRAGTTLVSGRVSTRSTWTGIDATAGVARYDVGLQTDGGAFVSIGTNVPRASIDRLISPEHDYAFRVRAKDQAGNVGDWVVGRTLSVSRFQETNARISYKGDWVTTTGTSYWGGKTRRSSDAGAKASIRFTGRSIAWVSRTGPAQGRATVYVNGVKVATVDLHASSSHSRRVVWAASWSTANSRKVTIQVTGTNGRPRVDVDAFVTVR